MRIKGKLCGLERERESEREKLRPRTEFSKHNLAQNLPIFLFVRTAARYLRSPNRHTHLSPVSLAHIFSSKLSVCLKVYAHIA